MADMPKKKKNEKNKPNQTKSNLIYMYEQGFGIK